MSEVTLFHLVRDADWAAFVVEGARYEPPSLAREGFIHLSTSSQWPRTRTRFFAGATGLLLVEVDPTGLDVRYEAADGDRFPHLYGPLPLSAVRAVTNV